MANESELSSLLAALADPTRRAVLESLRAGPRPVGEIARRLPVSRPAVSQHLKRLKDDGLVSDRAEGTRRVYSLRRQGLVPLRNYVESYWSEVLGAFGEFMHSDAEGARPKNGGKKS